MKAICFSNPTPARLDILQNVTWPIVDSSFPYLNIGSRLKISYKPKEEIYSMWEDIYARWGVPPYAAY